MRTSIKYVIYGLKFLCMPETGEQGHREMNEGNEELGWREKRVKTDWEKIGLSRYGALLKSGIDQVERKAAGGLKVLSREW